MALGIYLFKCRNCGVVYEHPEQDEMEFMQINFDSNMDKGHTRRICVDLPVMFMEKHLCDGNAQGIAECIALIEDEGSGSSSGSASGS